MNKSTYLKIEQSIKKNVQPNGIGYDDLIQETILRLLESDYKIKDYPKLCTKVAKNIIIDEYRKNNQFTYVYDKEVDKACYQKEICEKIKLPEKRNPIFVLRFKFNFKMREIAEILDIPLGTVQSTIFRIRKKVIKKYEKVN